MFIPEEMMEFIQMLKIKVCSKLKIKLMKFGLNKVTVT